MAFDQAQPPWGPRWTRFNGTSELFMTLNVVIFHVIDTSLQNLSSFHRHTSDNHVLQHRYSNIRPSDMHT